MANSTNHSYGKHQTGIINTEADENLGHGLEQAQKCSGSKTGSWDLNPWFINDQTEIKKQTKQKPLIFKFTCKSYFYL